MILEILRANLAKLCLIWIFLAWFDLLWSLVDKSIFLGDLEGVIDPTPTEKNLGGIPPFKFLSEFKRVMTILPLASSTCTGMNSTKGNIMMVWYHLRSNLVIKGLQLLPLDRQNGNRLSEGGVATKKVFGCILSMTSFFSVLQRLQYWNSDEKSYGKCGKALCSSWHFRRAQQNSNRFGTLRATLLQRSPKYILE